MIKENATKANQRVGLEDMVYGLQYNDGAIQPMPSLQAAMIAADSVYGGTVVWRYETPWEPLIKDDVA